MVRTGIRHVDPGNLIRAADNKNIVTVVQLQPIYVIITLPATELAAAGVSQGLSNLPVFAYAENGKTQLDRGTVQTINNEVDPATGTIKLKASFPNERLKLWPGRFHRLQGDGGKAAQWRDRSGYRDPAWSERRLRLVGPAR